ncbi:hypothetical protein Hanom_Chr01g00040971 [Helianthus anomalus]
MTQPCPAQTFLPYVTTYCETLKLTPHTGDLCSSSPQSISHPTDPSLPALHLSLSTNSN